MRPNSASKLKLHAVTFLAILSAIIFVPGEGGARAQTQGLGSGSFAHRSSGSLSFHGSPSTQWEFPQHDFVNEGRYGSHLAQNWGYGRWRQTPYGGLYSPLYWPHSGFYPYSRHLNSPYVYPFGPVPQRFVPWYYIRRFRGGWHSHR